MGRKILKNKPLVEAIFELRWELQGKNNERNIDPYYKILIGRIYERVKDKYPFPEQLPTATMPDEIAGYVVQHRFRKGKGEWPLIQIGPGIITLNDTDGYMWEDFEDRIYNDVIKNLFEVYPEPESNLKINSLLLRYIDGLNFDYSKNDIFTFLKEKMKTNIEIHKELLNDTGVNKLPLGFDLKFSFPSTKPKGFLHLRFVRGKKEDADALIWETQVQLKRNEVLNSKNEIIKWIKEAHELTDNWFFEMIEGELLRRFE